MLGTFAGTAKAQNEEPRPVLTAFSARKAELLLRERLPCLGCHALKGEGGRIGPDLATVRQRRSPQYIAAMIADPQRVAPGSPMPRPLIDRGTRELLLRYLTAQPGSGSDPVPGAIAPATSGNPGALYARFCAACHGSTGRGDGPNSRFLPTPATAHSSAELMSRRSDDALFDTIAGGGAIMNRSPRMPAFGGSLNASEITGLVRHIRTLCRCEGPSWSRDGGPR